MLFTRPLFAQGKRAVRFGDKSLPHLKSVPKDKLLGMSRRQLCWTVIIVTIPIIAVYSNIVYRRLVLGEEKRRSFREGGVDTGFMLDNIASTSAATKGATASSLGSDSSSNYVSKD